MSLHNAMRYFTREWVGIRVFNSVVTLIVTNYPKHDGMLTASYSPVLVRQAVLARPDSLSL